MISPKQANTALKIVLAFVVVAILTGLYFADSKLQSIAKSTNELETRAEIDAKKVQSYELTKMKLKELDYVKDLAEEILPQNEEQSVIVAELAEFAKRANLSTGSITFAEKDTVAAPTGPKAKTAKKTVPTGVAIVPVVFTVSDSAQYSDVLDFLKYIEQNRRKMQVTQISLKPDSDDGTKLQDVSLTINLFVKEAKKV